MGRTCRLLVFAIAIRHLALVVIRELDIVSITVNKPEADALFERR